MATAERETNAQYHADFEHVSHSMLEVFRRSPAEYHARYVARSQPDAGPTPEMLLGSLTHCVALEPERLEEEYVVAEGCKRRYGTEWDDWLAEADALGRILILPEQLALAHAMAAAVRQHKLGRFFFEGRGPVERPIRWTDPETGVRCKCKPDKLVFADDVVLVIDLKTAADPSPAAFGRQAGTLGYYRQAAFYTAGVKVYHRGRPVRFVFVAVGKTPPHDVWTYRLSPHDLLDGDADNVDALGRLAEAMETGRWLGRYDGKSQEQLIELPIPRYAKR